MTQQRLSHWLRRRFPLPRVPFTLRLQVGFVIAAAALLGVGFALEFRLRGLRDPWRMASTGWDSVAWFVWLAAAPIVLLLIRRYPLLRGEVARNLPRLLVRCAALYLTVASVRFALRGLPRIWDPQSDLVLGWQEFWTLNLVSLPMDLLTFGGFFCAALAIDYYAKHCEHVEETLALRLRTAQLESALANAELQALRGQLHPHFLFNSFNAVATLVRQARNDEAVETIAQLSLLLRMSIERTGQQQIELEEELEFVRRYLEIERIRFGAKLQVEYAIEPEANRAVVPNFLLQPFAENAIKHGISRRTEPGRIRIAAARRANRLEIVVENDGTESDASGPPTDGTRRGGVGLSNTRVRLEKLYPGDYHLDMIPGLAGEMTVRLDLPWRIAN